MNSLKEQAFFFFFKSGHRLNLGLYIFIANSPSHFIHVLFAIAFYYSKQTQEVFFTLALLLSEPGLIEWIVFILVLQLVSWPRSPFPAHFSLFTTPNKPDAANQLIS